MRESKPGKRIKHSLRLLLRFGSVLLHLHLVVSGLVGSVLFYQLLNKTIYRIHICTNTAESSTKVASTSEKNQARERQRTAELNNRPAGSREEEPAVADAAAAVLLAADSYGPPGTMYS